MAATTIKKASYHNAEGLAAVECIVIAEHKDRSGKVVALDLGLEKDGKVELVIGKCPIEPREGCCTITDPKPKPADPEKER